MRVTLSFSNSFGSRWLGFHLRAVKSFHSSLSHELVSFVVLKQIYAGARKKYQYTGDVVSTIYNVFVVGGANEILLTEGQKQR